MACSLDPAHSALYKPRIFPLIPMDRLGLSETFTAHTDGKAMPSGLRGQDIVGKSGPETPDSSANESLLRARAAAILNLKKVLK